jgi:hypothetical protein
MSQVTGAGGEEIGRLVIEKLGLRYLDDEIVEQAAERGGVTPADIADAERRKSFLHRFLDDLGSGLGAEAHAIARVPSVVGGGLAPDLQRLVVDAMQEVAAQGEVLIAAHGAAYALARQPNVLRVHVTASPETRAERLSQSAGLDRNAAERAIRDSDRSRDDYLRRYYGVEHEEPTHYDLVLNTDRLGSSEAADVVARAVS